MKAKTPTPFKALTAAEKRVAIAKDVLKQIKNQKLTPFTGRYYMVQGSRATSRFDQKVLLQQNPDCECCALGAAVISAIRLFNEFRLTDWNVNDYRKISKVLSNWFSLEQVALIEAAFEEGEARLIALNIKAPNRKDERAADKFRRRHNSSRSLCIAIFTNIIKNKGTFKP